MFSLYGACRMAFKHGVATAFLLFLAICGANSSAAAAPFQIVGLGDSLMAGYGLGPDQGFTDRLAAALKAQGHDVVIANAGVSGDTSSGGLSRLDWSVPDGTQLVILELGANDMLRGLDPKMTEANLAKMLEALQAKHVKVLLVGMRAPPSMGPEYQQSFAAIYPALAKRYAVPLYPFFLEGVIGDRKLHLADQLHPTGEGVGVIVQKILPDVDKLLDGVPAKS